MIYRQSGYGGYVQTVDELSELPRHLHGTVVPVDDVLAGVFREIAMRTAPVFVTYRQLPRRR